MARQGLENNRVRGLILESVKLYVPEVLAITAAQVLVAGMPYLLAYDPAATTRAITMYTPAVAGLAVEHEIVNIGTGAGNLTIQSPAAATIGSIPAGGRAIVRWVNGAWNCYMQLSQGTGGQFNTNAAKQTIALYSTLAGLVNTNVMAVAIPFNFTLTAVRFVPRTPATTAAKLATLTAGLSAAAGGALTPVTGGVISLTSANMTPTNTPQAGTAITALNTGVAGARAGVTVSGVTAFVEGDGYLEMDVLNTSLAA